MPDDANNNQANTLEINENICFNVMGEDQVEAQKKYNLACDEESSKITDEVVPRIHSDIAFRVLKDIEKNPEITQRCLAEKHDISLGKTNYILNALIERGIVKAHNFKNSRNKAAYMYVFTPEGITIKTQLARNFIQRKIREFELLKLEIEQLKKEMDIEQ